MSPNVVTDITPDRSDKFSSGLFAHENSLKWLPNRAIQFYSKYSMDQEIVKDFKEEEETKDLDLDFDNGMNL